MAPIAVFGYEIGMGGDEDHTNPIDLAELRLVHRVGHEGGVTGNQAIRHWLSRGELPIFLPKDRRYAGLENFQGSQENGELIGNILENPIAKGVFEIFATINNLPECDVSILENRLSESMSGRNTICMYGCSGTELNSKELGNTLGAVKSMNDNGVPTVGVYFIEPSGHPFDGVVASESEFWALDLAEEYNLEPQVATEKAKAAINTLYASSGQIGIYNPDNENIKKIIESVPVESRDEVAQAFTELDRTFADPENIIYGPANNIKAPTSQTVENCFDQLGVSEADKVRKIYIEVAKYLEKNFEGQASVSDMQTMIQGILTLDLSYNAHGAEEMPLVLPVRWDHLCAYTGVKTDYTIDDAAREIVRDYGEGKVLGAACPVTRKELKISVDENGNRIIENLKEGQNSPFQTIVSHVGNISMDRWIFGGNSGKMYYQIMDRMFGLYGIRGTIFLDNYENEGPHKAIIEKESERRNSLSVITPRNRCWAVHNNHIPRKDNGEINGDAIMGAAVPTANLARHLYNLADKDRKAALQRWFELNGPGLEDNVGAISTSFNGVSVYYAERGIIAASPNGAIPDIPVSAAKHLLNFKPEQIQNDLGIDELDQLITEYNQHQSIIYQATDEITQLNQKIGEIGKNPNLIHFRAANNAYQEALRRKTLELAMQNEEIQRLIAVNPIETLKEFSDKPAGELLELIESSEIEEITISESTDFTKGVISIDNYGKFYSTLVREAQNQVAEQIRSIILKAYGSNYDKRNTNLQKWIQNLERKGIENFINGQDIADYAQFLEEENLVITPEDSNFDTLPSQVSNLSNYIVQQSLAGSNLKVDDIDPSVIFSKFNPKTDDADEKVEFHKVDASVLRELIRLARINRMFGDVASLPNDRVKTLYDKLIQLETYKEKYRSEVEQKMSGDNELQELYALEQKAKAQVPTELFEQEKILLDMRNGLRAAMRTSKQELDSIQLKLKPYYNKAELVSQLAEPFPES